MFEHLPLITDDNLSTVVEKEIDYFQDLLERSTKEAETPNQAIDLMCSELSKTNPNLIRAIRGGVYSVAELLENDCGSQMAWSGGLAVAPGILVVLRLIDRALEAQQLEDKIASLKEE